LATHPAPYGWRLWQLTAGDDRQPVSPGHPVVFAGPIIDAHCPHGQQVPSPRCVCGFTMCHVWRASSPIALCLIPYWWNVLPCVVACFVDACQWGVNVAVEYHGRYSRARRRVGTPISVATPSHRSEFRLAARVIHHCGRSVQRSVDLVVVDEDRCRVERDDQRVI
jgi:hypothetical protein